MKKRIMSFTELIRKNKEELMNDKALMEKIEKRLDDKYVKSK